MRITEVERRPDGTIVTLDCGHVVILNPIFTYTVGARTRCFLCDQHGEALKYDENPEQWAHILNREVA